MIESMSEDTKLLLGHIFYRVKEMIRALIEDGDWPPIPALMNHQPTWEAAAALARKWELKQLAKRLEEMQPD